MSEQRSRIRTWSFLQADDRLRGIITRQYDVYRAGYKGDGKIADKLGVKPQKIRDYLKGQRPNLNDFELVKFANTIGVNIDLYVTLDGEYASNP